MKRSLQCGKPVANLLCASGRWLGATAFVAMLLASAQGASAQPSLTPPSDAVVELYTFETGEILFQRFGHAAICLRRDLRSACFNYGVTNFDDPVGLAWGFLRTKQAFWVEAVDLNWLLQVYAAADRTIWRQTLPLSAQGVAQVVARLSHDVKPENREYYYDHFFDNCTTVLRDMIDDASAGALRRGVTGNHALTFRQFGQRGLAEFPALLAITDFVVGRTLDRHATNWEAMFHPDELRLQVERVLGAKAVVVNARRGAGVPTTGPGWRGWMLLVAVLFALPLGLARYANVWRRRPRWARAAELWAWLPLAFWSILIWTAVIVSSIPGLRWNEAVVLFVPLDLLLPWMPTPRRATYARIRLLMVIAASLMCALGVFRQPLWVPIVTAALPLWLFAWPRPTPAAQTQ